MVIIQGLLIGGEECIPLRGISLRSKSEKALRQKQKGSRAKGKSEKAKRRIKSRIKSADTNVTNVTNMTINPAIYGGG